MFDLLIYFYDRHCSFPYFYCKNIYNLSSTEVSFCLLITLVAKTKLPQIKCRKNIRSNYGILVETMASIVSFVLCDISWREMPFLSGFALLIFGSASSTRAHRKFGFCCYTGTKWLLWVFFHWRHWNIYSASCFGFPACGDATRLASRFWCLSPLSRSAPLCQLVVFYGFVHLKWAVSCG